ncbi:hypothetical protein BST36_29665 [Mycolicibacterium moriokaense]|uniref:Gp13 protein n=1 Tax=Mycolicibacterium moriokaense TaxID=39691 RepID=A0AAD1M532_9MYCO|nr:hypothetical protein [Mycolicibacterium moriokaense]MCV7037461.1 hypothetical protein [Mycolicibacterium moriokaense]ORB13104.1 hypothetical protein BST36_29665 [Mycolicibacterium moriokaense]BBX00917.1 hypothetical protein MMOR_18530 [Mycolicibacterium moriokaense]
MTSVLAPVPFDAPLVNPSVGGLFTVTQWQPTAGDVERWLPDGVEIKPWNYGIDDSFGVWAAAWNASEEDLDPEADVKRAADRPSALPVFAAVTTWAADECDLTAPSRDEIRTRAAQIHRLREPIAVEAEFAARLLDDVDTPTEVVDVVAAVGALDEMLAATNTLGFIHGRPSWMSVAAQANLLVRTGSVFKTPSGHTWVFGGGYPETLGDTLVATSQPFGWRGEVHLHPAEKLEHNRFHVIAERSLVIGYEALIGAVDIVGPETP